MKKFFLKILKVLIVIYVLVCAGLYFFQERIIFHPQKLLADYQFSFEQKFEELQIKTNDGILLNGVLFKTDSAKGVVFYLHGQGGSIASNPDIASFYTSLHYDVFMFDYRGYGKSEGKITNLDQLFQDNQSMYDFLKKQYPENKIIVLGYSLGTGFAAKIAADNHPEMLLLQAPYYSLADMMVHRYKIIPTFLLKYNIATNEYIPNCKMPIIDFHGTADETVYYGSSLKLQKEFKKGDKLITMPGKGHNRIVENPLYQSAVQSILEK